MRNPLANHDEWMPQKRHQEKGPLNMCGVSLGREAISERGEGGEGTDDKLVKFL